MDTKKVTHIFPPVYTPDSKILILGTMPSQKSRENGFYYTHPRNRFWPILALLTGEAVPTDIAGMQALLYKHHIALWDVLESCYIKGASDASICHEKPNDIAALLKQTSIKAIFTTGSKAYNLYNKYCLANTGIDAIPLQSSSPANCCVSFEALADKYSIILKYL